MTDIDKFIESIIPFEAETDGRCLEDIIAEEAYNKCRKETRKLLKKAFEDGKIWRAIDEKDLEEIIERDRYQAGLQTIPSKYLAQAIIKLLSGKE